VFEIKWPLLHILISPQCVVEARGTTFITGKRPLKKVFSGLHEALEKVNSDRSVGRFILEQKNDYSTVIFTSKIETKISSQILTELYNSYLNGRYHLERKYLNIILNARPIKDIPILIREANNNHDSVKLKKCIDYLSLVNHEQPTNYEVLDLLAFAHIILSTFTTRPYLQRNRIRQSILFSKQCLTLKKKPDVFNNLGISHAAIARTYSNGKDLKKVAKYFYKALYYYKTGLENTKNDPGLYNNAANVFFELGRIQFKRNVLQQAAQSLQDAVNHYTKSIEIKIDNEVINSLGLCYHNFSKIYLQIGELDKADQKLRRSIENFERSLQLEVEEPETLGSLGLSHYDLGRLYLQKGELDSAKQQLDKSVKYYQKYLRLIGSDSEALNNLGAAYKQISRFYGQKGSPKKSDQQLENAIKYFTEALKAKPENPETLSNLGQTMVDLIKYEDGFFQLCKASEGFLKNGKILRALGALIVAIDCLNHFTLSQRRALLTDRGNKTADFAFLDELKVALHGFPMAWKVKTMSVLLPVAILRRHNINISDLYPEVFEIRHYKEVIGLGRFFINLLLEFQTQKRTLVLISNLFVSDENLIHNLPFGQGLSIFIKQFYPLLSHIAQGCIDRAKLLSDSPSDRVEAEKLQVILSFVAAQYLSAENAALNALNLMKKSGAYFTQASNRFWFEGIVHISKFAKTGSIDSLNELDKLASRAWRTNSHEEAYMLSTWTATGYLEIEEYAIAHECCERWIAISFKTRVSKNLEAILGILRKIHKLRVIGIEAYCHFESSNAAIIRYADRYRLVTLRNLSKASEAQSSQIEDICLYFLPRLAGVERLLRLKGKWHSLNTISNKELEPPLLEWLEFIERCETLTSQDSLPDLPEEILRHLSSIVLQDIPLNVNQPIRIIPCGLLNLLPFGVLPVGERRLIQQNQVEILPCLTLSSRKKFKQPSRTLWMALADFNGEYHPLGLDVIEKNLAEHTLIFSKNDTFPNYYELFKKKRWKRIVLIAHGEFDPLRPLDAHLKLPGGKKLYGLDLGKGPSVSKLRITAQELCLLACASGATETGPGEEMLGMIWGWMSIGVKIIACCYWQIPVASAVYVILRLADFSGVELPQVIRKIQLELFEGKLSNKILRYLAANSNILFGWPAPSYWIRDQLKHPFYWASIGIFKSAYN